MYKQNISNDKLSSWRLIGIVKYYRDHELTTTENVESLSTCFLIACNSSKVQIYNLTTNITQDFRCRAEFLNSTPLNQNPMIHISNFNLFSILCYHLTLLTVGNYLTSMSLNSNRHDVLLKTLISLIDIYPPRNLKTLSFILVEVMNMYSCRIAS